MINTGAKGQALSDSTFIPRETLNCLMNSRGLSTLLRGGGQPVIGYFVTEDLFLTTSDMVDMSHFSGHLLSENGKRIGPGKNKNFRHLRMGKRLTAVSLS